MRLRHLHPDGATAQDHKVIRARAQIEQRLVGKKGHRVQPRYRRDQRRGPRRDHDPAGPDALPAHLDPVRRGEPGMVAQHGDPQPLEPLLAVMRGDGGDGAGDVIHHGRIVDVGLHGPDAERARVAHRLRPRRRRQQRLGRNAAVVEAVAPPPATFGQNHARTHLCRPRSDGQPARPRADHQQVASQVAHHTPRPRRSGFSRIGSAASRHSPRIGSSTRGSKMIPRFGVSPRAKTAPSPAPTEV